MLFAQTIALFVALYFTFLIAVRGIALLSPKPIETYGGIGSIHSLAVSVAWSVFFGLMRM